MAIVLNTKDGVSYDPTAFVIERATIKNDNDEHNLTNLILDLKITENIYNSTMICECAFFDSLNIADKIKFHGEDTFNLKITKTTLAGTDNFEFEHEFKISHWSGLARIENERYQTWKFSAISKELYTNQSLKISKYIAGPTIDSIKGIAETIGITLDVKGESTQSTKGIIPISNPLQAISWLNRNLLDDEDTPFYLFQDNTSSYNFVSHSKLVNTESIGEWNYVRKDSTTSGTVENYNQRLYAMVDAGGDYDTSKYNQIDSGLMSSKLTYVTALNKRIENHYYDYVKDFPVNQTLYPKSGMRIDDSTFDIDLSNPEANQNYIASDNSYSSNVAGTLTPDQRAIRAGWNSALTGPGLEVTVPINLNIKAGAVVTLNFPKTIDDGDDKPDKYLSGKYLVISSTHNFSGTAGYTRALLKRDSIRQ